VIDYIALGMVLSLLAVRSEAELRVECDADSFLALLWLVVVSLLLEDALTCPLCMLLTAAKGVERVDLLAMRVAFCEVMAADRAIGSAVVRCRPVLWLAVRWVNWLR
jgi:hypothetical protein